jgi:F-type H+-transporting ATPase subunit b
MRVVRNNSRLLVAAAAAALAVLVLADPALAAAAPADHGGGEDKLAFLGLKRYDLGIYTLIVFGLLLFILSKYAWPHISEGLQKREAAIIGARDEAIKARAEAEETRAKLQKDYAEAQDKIRAMLDEARRDADALKVAEKEAGVREAAAERDRAKREITSEKEGIRQELHEYAVQLAAMLSAKTIRRELTADDHRRLLAESLAELKNGVKA